MNRSKSIMVAAGVALALALTSCGGSKPPPANTGFSDVLDYADEYRKKCRIELKEYVCGVGQNTSTNAQISRDVATAIARDELSAQVKASIESALKRTATVALNEQANETTFQRLVQEVSSDFGNIEIYETKTQYNPEEKKYKIYSFVVAKKEDIKNAANNKVANSQVLSDAVSSEMFMKIVDEELDKGKSR